MGHVEVLRVKRAGNQAEPSRTWPSHTPQAHASDALRGMAFSGLSFDEYGLHPPAIFSEVLSKALADHLGYAIFAGTLKLHGSLNFGTCKQCGIIPWRLEKYLYALSVGQIVRPTYVGPGKLRLNIGSDIGQFHHCNHPDPCQPEPVVVPPTWSKGTRYRDIQTVWQRAAKEPRLRQRVFSSLDTRGRTATSSSIICMASEL